MDSSSAKKKEQKKLSAYQKQLLLDKVNVSDKEIKENSKKHHTF